MLPGLMCTCICTVVVVDEEEEALDHEASQERELDFCCTSSSVLLNFSFFYRSISFLSFISSLPSLKGTTKEYKRLLLLLLVFSSNSIKTPC